MTIKVYLIAIVLCLTKSAFAQDSTRIYFIRKIEPNKLFVNPNLYSSDTKLESIGVKVYQLRDNKKIDSSFVFAKTIKKWKDSISFKINVPNHMVTEKTTL